MKRASNVGGPVEGNHGLEIEGLKEPQVAPWQLVVLAIITALSVLSLVERIIGMF